jgi:penicillin amidase
MEVTITHHGPVIAGDPASGTGVAISDPGLIEASPWLDAVRDAMRARSVDELHQAFAQWNDRVNNYAVADVHGNFGYLHEGRIPIRGQANGWRAVPGWSGEYEWQGYVPHDELPRALNPEVGYAVTCNQRVAAHDYPYYVGLYFSPEYRARRIQTRILELESGAATVDDMARIHAERISNPARTFTRLLLEAPAANPACARAQDLLRPWDYSMDRDQVQPSIYAQTRAQATRFLAEHLLGTLAPEALGGAAGSDIYVRLIEWGMIEGIERGDTALLPPGMEWKEVLSGALERGVAELAERLGDDLAQWQWGRIHRTAPQHPLSAVFPQLGEWLDPPSLPVHGDGDTPLAGSYGSGRLFVVTGLSVNRYILDPADWTRSRWIVPLGASGHPGSPHYADQAELWAGVEYIPQLWDWQEIAARAESRQKLEA